MSASPTEQKPPRIARVATLLTTNLIKLGGLGAALNELFLRPTARTSAIALSAFMMAGAQLSEHALLAALDRLIGKEPAEEKKP